MNCLKNIYITQNRAELQGLKETSRYYQVKPFCWSSRSHRQSDGSWLSPNKVTLQLLCTDCSSALSPSLQRSSSSLLCGISYVSAFGHFSLSYQHTPLKRVWHYPIDSHTLDIYNHLNLLFSKLNRTRCLSLSLYRRCSRPLSSLLSTGLFLGYPCLFWSGEPRTGHSIPDVALSGQSKGGGSHPSTWWPCSS